MSPVWYLGGCFCVIFETPDILHAAPIHFIQNGVNVIRGDVYQDAGGKYEVEKPILERNIESRI